MSKIAIYQNYITESDTNQLDPSFIPNDWMHNPTPELRENAIFFDFFDTKRYQCAEYVGVLSKKFNAKTKLSGEKFIEFIENNPNYDVYFINPFPQNAYFSYNVWQHGEMHHPGIIKATQKLFDFSKININVIDFTRNSRNTLLYSNFWVGSHRFWEMYIPFLKNLYDNISNKMNSKDQAIYFSDTPHDGTHYYLLPFIFERLFSTYIIYNNVKYLGYSHTKEEILAACINDIEREITIKFGSCVDQLDKMKLDSIRSKELLDCITKALNFLQTGK